MVRFSDRLSPLSKQKRCIGIHIVHSRNERTEEDEGIVFVRSEALRAVHTSLIDAYGGLPGIRDENALESAIGRPRNLAAYGDVSSIFTLAAALPWAILRNHPFTDGNKRVAFASLVIFYNATVVALYARKVNKPQWSSVRLPARSRKKSGQPGSIAL